MNFHYIPIQNLYTLYFFLAASLLITLSSVYQNLFIYQDIKSNTITNKERIIIQIKKLLESQQNLIPIYALLIATTTIAIIKRVFNIGIQDNYLLEIIIFFLFVSTIIEYQFFMLPVAVKAEEYSVSIEDELTTRETHPQRIKQEISQSLKEEFNQLDTKNRFSKKNCDIITSILNGLNKEYKYSIEETKILLEKQESFFKKNGFDRIENSFLIRDKDYTIYELYIENEELILNIINPTPSMAYFHFYKEINIHQTLIKSIFEGIVVSLILLMSLTLKF